jgi:hypothetical protein
VLVEAVGVGTRLVTGGNGAELADVELDGLTTALGAPFVVAAPHAVRAVTQTTAAPLTTSTRRCTRPPYRPDHVVRPMCAARRDRTWGPLR